MWGRGLLSAVLAQLPPRRSERASAPRETPREAPSAAAPALSGATELAHVLPGKTCAGCPSPLLRPVVLWNTLPAGKAKHLNFFFLLDITCSKRPAHRAARARAFRRNWAFPCVFGEDVQPAAPIRCWAQSSCGRRCWLKNKLSQLLLFLKSRLSRRRREMHVFARVFQTSSLKTQSFRIVRLT